MPKPTFPPPTGRTWQYTTTHSGLEKNLFLNPANPLPHPKPSQHLIQVIAVALNPVDYKPAEVALMSRFMIPKPATPGNDFAGRIVHPASGSSLQPGQLVFGATAKTPFAAGALSEFAIAEASQTVAIPKGVDPVDAAGIAVAGSTAYQCIVPRVKPGDRVFINGGSGGTGTFGIQIAKKAGCYVATTCSTPNVELCKSLGADLVVDYKKGSVIEALKASGVKFDLVVDNVGNFDLYWKSHLFTSPKAAFVMAAGTPSLSFMYNTMKVRLWPRWLGGGKRSYSGFFAEARADELERIAQWMAEGEVKAVIDSKWAFEDAVKAFEKLKTGRARGKVVIDVAVGTHEKAWER